MNKERAAGYLAQGVGAGQVAKIMGVTPGYISQLLKEEDFKLLVEKSKSLNDGSEEAEQQSIQKKYTGLEHQILTAIAESLPNAELPALTRALEVVANRQDKVMARKMPAAINGGGGNGVNVHVTLTLPAHAIPSAPVIQLNEKSEVVAIDSKPMSPMSSVGVERLFKQKKAVEALIKEL